jgi:mannose-6-phosphate isomerase-like protein (cupin superfamily)
MTIVSKENALQYQQWGDHCDSWILVDEETLSVKLERMPPATAEQKHFHSLAGQFFFILKGRAVFEINEEKILVETDHGIHIRPLIKHKICNQEETDLEFILSSQPSTRNDRINCE